VSSHRERENFFFAGKDAAYYDVTVGMTAPHYRIMHEVVLALADARDPLVVVGEELHEPAQGSDDSRLA